MQKYTKLTLVLVIIFAIGGYLLMSNVNKESINTNNTQTQDDKVSKETTVPEITSEIPPNAIVSQASSQTKSQAPQTAPKPSNTLTYKGQYFPFEFSYPVDFRPVKNPKPSNQDGETGTYNFNFLAINGGIAGFVSFYVSLGDSTQYEDLIATHPDNYSKVIINGNQFYKHTEKESSSNKGYRIEYITFKNGVEYRFSLIVSNGDRRDLDISSYKTQSDMLESIVRSLRIS